MKTCILLTILSFFLITHHIPVHAELPPYADSCIFATIAGTAFYVGSFFSDSQFLGTTAKDFAVAVGVYALWRGYNQLYAEKPATSAQIAATTTYDSLCVTGSALTQLTINKIIQALPDNIKNNKFSTITTSTNQTNAWLYSLTMVSGALGYRTYNHPLKQQRNLATAQKTLDAFQLQQLLTILKTTRDDKITLNFPNPALVEKYFKLSNDPLKQENCDVQNCIKKGIKITVNKARESKFFEELDTHTQAEINKEESRISNRESFFKAFLQHTISSSPLLLSEFKDMALTRSALSFVGVKLLFDLHDTLYEYYFPEQKQAQNDKPFYAA